MSNVIRQTGGERMGREALPPPPRLLDRVRDAVRVRGLLIWRAADTMRLRIR